MFYKNLCIQNQNLISTYLIFILVLIISIFLVNINNNKEEISLKLILFKS